MKYKKLMQNSTLSTDSVFYFILDCIFDNQKKQKIQNLQRLYINLQEIQNPQLKIPYEKRRKDQLKISFVTVCFFFEKLQQIAFTEFFSLSNEGNGNGRLNSQKVHNNQIARRRLRCGKCSCFARSHRNDQNQLRENDKVNYLKKWLTKFELQSNGEIKRNQHRWIKNDIKLLCISSLMLTKNKLIKKLAGN